MKKIIYTVKYIILLSFIIFMIYNVVVTAINMNVRYNSIDITNENGWRNEEYAVTMSFHLPDEWTGKYSIIGKLGNYDVHYENQPIGNLVCYDRDLHYVKLFEARCYKKDDTLVVEDIKTTDWYNGEPLPQKMILESGDDGCE